MVLAMRKLLCGALPVLLFSFPARAQTVNISGTVTDSAGVPVAGATVQLEKAGTTATSGADGKFTLASGVGIHASDAKSPRAHWHAGGMVVHLPERSRLAVTAYGLDGSVLGRNHHELNAGSHHLSPPGEGAGVRFYTVVGNGFSAVVRGLALEGVLHGAPAGAAAARTALAKSAAGEMYDAITATKSGYLKSYFSVAKAETSGVVIKLLKTTSPKFSFFVTSMRGLQALAKSDKGFGGDLRFGETGPGAGLRGADKICRTLAEQSMPASSFKGWRAFMSVSSDAYGKQVNAIDRVGAGPWYDRLGRLMAPTLNDLKNTRPMNGDATIQNDLPNETGVLNHHPGPSGAEEDNHHMLTGSTTAGVLKGASATCKDWTTSVHSTENGKPACGLAFPRGGGGGGGPGGGTMGQHWIYGFDAPGCAAGVEIVIGGGPTPEAAAGGWIGGGGGYGGFYCFALNP